jgi:predicted ATPase
VDTQGDAFLVAFSSATEALRAAGQAQDRLAEGPIRVRMGVHTGTPLLSDEGYVGQDLHKAARIAASAHGGQVVLSREARDRAGREFALTDLGEHRVKDFTDPVWIFQLGAGRFPPLRTISNTNLPRPASSFVGRTRELKEIVSLLRDGSRLVTLTGPGGTGKTRLSIEAAAELVPTFTGGVFWVGLATLTDPDLVIETVAQTLGAKDGLAEHIAARRMLLVLDNLEQIIGCGPLLASLVEACPNLALLVTSRALLLVRGEIPYAVPALAEPEAVGLFCARSGVERDADVEELCRRLDNLPLAIELAAARVRVLTPAQILERLSQRLDLFRGGRDADPRQATLRATIDWSYHLLDDQDQRLFAELSLFRGGFTLDAAEEVVGADLDGVQGLVEKSLLRRTGGRFWMLETIAEYAAERLVKRGEVNALRARLVTFLLSRYAEAPSWGDAAWIDSLEAERDNLREAMRWTIASKQADATLLLAAAFGALCHAHGPVSEGRAWLEEALRLGSQTSPPARVNALIEAASLAKAQGDLVRALSLGETSVSLAHTLEDPATLGRALVTLGIIVEDALDHERSETLLREALAVFRASGNGSEVRSTLGLLGFDAIARGDLAEAGSVLEEALALSREARDARGVLRSVGNLWYVLARQGRLGEALPLLQESVLVAHELSDLPALACQLEDVAAVAVELRRWERGAVMVGGAAAIMESTGHTFEPVQLRQHEGTVSALRRELGEDGLTASLHRGQQMSADELVTYTVEFVALALPTGAG